MSGSWVDEQAPTADPPRPPRRRRLLPVLAGALAVAALAGLVGGVGWWTHPHVFSPGGATFVMEPQPVETFPFYVGFGYAGDVDGAETITLRSVRVHFRDNTARATATFSVCTRRPVAEGNLALGNGLAGNGMELSTYCTDLRPVRPGLRMRPHGGRDYLIATITPTRPGRAVFGDVEVSYTRDAAHLFQRGTQHLDESTTIRVSER